MITEYSCPYPLILWHSLTFAALKSKWSSLSDLSVSGHPNRVTVLLMAAFNTKSIAS